MALPVFRRFSIQDYSKAPDWLSQFFQSLNAFCETSVNVLDKNLTIGQNVQGQKFTTNFRTSANYYPGGEFQTLKFAYTGGGQPTCCMLGQIIKLDAPPSVQVRLPQSVLDPISVTDWSMNINVSPYQLEINYVAGLENNTNYTATFIVL